MWNNWIEALTIENPNWAIFDMNNRKNHGIAAWLLSTLFIADIKDNVVSLTHGRYLVELVNENVKYLIYTVLKGLVILTLYFLKVKKQRKEPLKLFWEWSLLLVIPLFFPQ